MKRNKYILKNNYTISKEELNNNIQQQTGYITFLLNRLM